MINLTIFSKISSYFSPQKTPLPSFSTPVKSSLLTSNAAVLGIWQEVISEAAEFYFQFDFVSTKRIYNQIGKELYAAFPAISLPGMW